MILIYGDFAHSFSVFFHNLFCRSSAWGRENVGHDAFPQHPDFGFMAPCGGFLSGRWRPRVAIARGKS